MPSIPIQNITPLAANLVTGGESVPVVQRMGSNFYTYQTPISNFFYRNAIPFSALSGCPITWSTNTTTINSDVVIGSGSALEDLTVEGTVYLGGGTAQWGSTSVDIDNRTNTYAVFGPAGSSNDFAYLRQIGGDNSLTLALDLHDDGNHPTASQGFVIRKVASSAGTLDPITTIFCISGTGNVGIGTTNPSTALDVVGSVTLSQNNESLRFTDVSGTFPRLTMQNDNNFVFYGTNSTGGSRAIYSIPQRSNTSTFKFDVPVGIGRNALSANPYNSTTLVNLDVEGQIRASANSEEGGRIIIGNTRKAGKGVDNWAIWNMTSSGTYNYNNGLAFWKYSADGTNGGSTLFLSDSANGAVGIGPGFRTPTAPLHVLADTGNPHTNGIRLENTKTGASDGATIAVCTNGTNSGDPKVSWDITGVVGWSAGIDNSDSKKFKIANNWNDLTTRTRMVISPTDNNGVGGHTSFLINNMTEDDVAKPDTWGGGISTWDVFATGSVGVGPKGVVKAFMTSTGSMGAVSFNSTSSIRFKKNVEPLKDSLDKIQKLQGVTYNWKDTDKPDIGLIAEEVNKIYPDIVRKGEDNIPEAIDYGKLTAVLIESVKELTEKVKILEGKVK